MDFLGFKPEVRGTNDLILVSPEKKCFKSAMSKKMPEQNNGCGHSLIQDAKNLTDLVGKYEKGQEIHRPRWNPLKSLLEGYRGLLDLETAIKSAAYAEDLVGQSYQSEWNGIVIRHTHQRRIKKSALHKAYKILKSKTEELKSCKSFDDIFDCIRTNCQDINGIGPLYIYDSALRIGAFKNKLPKQVYVQSGALVGAKNLGLDGKNSPLPIGKFPEPLQHLGAHQIEDFLCIFKTELKDIMI